LPPSPLVFPLSHPPLPRLAAPGAHRAHGSVLGGVSHAVQVSHLPVEQKVEHRPDADEDRQDEDIILCPSCTRSRATGTRP